MKIDLNEPEKKSVVMSRTDFSQPEIATVEMSEQKSATTKKKKKGKSKKQQVTCNSTTSAELTAGSHGLRWVGLLDRMIRFGAACIGARGL